MLTFQNWKGFFLASRPSNLLIVFVSFSIAAFFSSLYTFEFLQNRLYWLQGVCIVLIAAAGYIVNDLYDYKIDLLNKPEKTYVNIYASGKKFWTSYFVLNFIAIFLSFWTPLKFLFINVGSILLLYFYARYFKRMAVIGNLVVATMTSMVIICGGLLLHIKVPLMWMAIFSFEITLLREIVKDVEDIRGDLRNGLKTMPIVSGLRLTTKIIFFLYIWILISLFFPFFFHYFLTNEFLWIYLGIVLIFVGLPLMISYRKLRNNPFSVSLYAQASKELKFIIIGGLISVFFLK